MTMETEARNPFHTFAEKSGEYYENTFLTIQKSELPRTHINFAAMIGSFFWAAMRGNWLLFIIAFVIDLITAVNLASYYKYSNAAIEFSDRANLVDRYTDWASSSMLAAILIFIVGRLLVGWLADRLYERQYNKWRISEKTPSGVDLSRLITVGLVFLLIVPLMIYRTAQFAPDERSCIRQDRAIASGEIVPFKKQFDCMIIGEFPTLFWIDRPDEVSYPRGDDGQRFIQRTPAPEGAPPVNLNVYVSQSIDDSIEYLTIFHAYLFDSIKDTLESMLTAIEAVFVGSPWPITMGVLIFVAFKLAGIRTAIFVTACLVYLAIFSFWNTAMSTLSLVIAASIVCIVTGLPLGVWVGKSRRGQAIVTPILDVMQTIPSFVYLLPAIAFFGIGKVPGILATVTFAMPPMVRLTALGIRQVPESTKEAALAFGANPRQLLYKVELPLALNSIMTGVNQVVMMCLAMVVVAALIGARGMGAIVTEALTNVESGRGILAGLGIALLAMMVDRVVQKANKMKT